MDPDWTSADAELEAILDSLRKYAATVRKAGSGLDPDAYSLDVVEAVLLERLRDEPDHARRVLAFCFVVAMRWVSGEGETAPRL